MSFDSAQPAYADAAWFSERFEALVANIETFIKGKPAVVRMAVVCMVAEGHLLIDDVPGVGKTSLAKAISHSIDASMRRIQFTPDLLPSDVTGVSIFNQASREFEFRPGGVFANIVLGDEINRASPKTQSALLEVMEERQVTVDSVPYPVPDPFVVIATQNPVEQGGTYELPEAQRDRFMMRMSMGYPSHEAEREIIVNRVNGYRAENLRPVMTLAEFQQMIAFARGVHLADSISAYIVTLVQATRRLPELRLGVSPRGSVALAVASQSHAAASGRTFVTADDVKAMAPIVLPHRMLLRPEAELQGADATTLLAQLLGAVPVPSQPTRL
ncbi:MAG: MoxR family ATPase [Kineosporiaceae bacterium]